MFSSTKKNRWQDNASRVLAVGLIAIPTFWLALGLQYILSGKLHLLPLSGGGSVEMMYLSPIRQITHFPLIDSLITLNFKGFWDHLTHMILPVMALAGLQIGGLQRLTRAQMLDALGDEYVTAARSYGLSERRVVWQRALKGSLGPLATVIGLELAGMITGSFIIESIFSWPGIGSLVVQALGNLDYPVIMAITLIGACAYLTMQHDSRHNHGR